MDEATRASIAATVSTALAEDVGSGDVTAQLIPLGRSARAELTCREDAVLCGRAWAEEVYRQIDPQVMLHWSYDEGARIAAGTAICRLEGPARAMLTGERCAMNFLQTLSGTATAAARYVEVVSGTGAAILDTRKTLPGLRLAQKYAARCGGASNHRVGLFDAILIKENHIFAAGSITAAVTAARHLDAAVPLEVEVEDLAGASEAIAAGARSLLLDNFTLEMLREAVALRDRDAPETTLEASGGVSLDTVRAIAETGVDFISVGGITKHLQAVDLSMRFELSA
ncbi:MAG: carboxylating nicotinate-nucleotide diphosphorylase [Gammaproteobacteria bacterium]|nr:carboxylating nicotinate-nucleotide diphosphorylase [Gammaproteobacteria bacterium]